MGDAADADTDTAAAMAAAMGFSSFGAQKPNKRRKFNPSTDAVVAPAESSTSTLPFHRYNDAGDYNHNGTTGSNAIPLGARRQNVDEIDLDDHDDLQDLQDLPSSHQAAHLTTAAGDNPGPHHLDASPPSVPVVVEPADVLQSRIDAIVDFSADAHSSLQPPPSPAVGAGHLNHGGRGGHQHTSNRDDRSSTRWWDDYYDPAFIINPWDKLEIANGLESRGSWVSWEEAKAAQT
ncbi:hypothetical protein F5Y03DRAFT_291000 [Xylaria venustula]|nr:hypothetical protein F5Y03DRAFT_291000 [Xylaria venustula]